MRILVDRTTNGILEVEKVPEIGRFAPTNGKYVLPTPEGVSLHVEPTSFVLPSNNPNSVVAQAYAGLLAQFPQYDNILYNPLLEAADVDDIVVDASSPSAPTLTDPDTGDSFRTRAITGRGTGGPFTAGQAPNNTAMLAANTGAAPTAPGLVISDTIDVSPFTGGIGSDEFVAYWYIYDCDATQDVRSDFGATAGLNTPSLVAALEVDQEPSDLQVYLSINDGVSWTEVQRLVPVSFCTPGTSVRLAFRNNAPTRRKCIAAYAVMF